MPMIKSGVTRIYHKSLVGEMKKTAGREIACTDLAYYKSTYIGSHDAEITKWLSRAADDIDAMTGGIDTDTLNSFQLELVKKANCAQAEFYIMNGDVMGGSASSISLGSFSMSGASETGSFSSRARNYLNQAGFGLPVSGSRRSVP